MVIFLQARSTDWITIMVMCSRFSDWPILIRNRLYDFNRILSDVYSDVLYSEKCQKRKALSLS